MFASFAEEGTHALTPNYQLALEPESYQLFLAGALLVAFTVRRAWAVFLAFTRAALMQVAADALLSITIAYAVIGTLVTGGIFGACKDSVGRPRSGR